MKEEEPHIPTTQEPNTNETEPLKPRFKLGQVVGTPGALQAFEETGQNPLELLLRHATGDWGELCDEDRAENELSVEQGFRILSAYRLNNDTRVWVITEWDRSVTTILLPDEY